MPPARHKHEMSGDSMDSNEINILFAGDTFLQSGNNESPFDDVAQVFLDHDLILLNLETAITNRKHPVGIKSVNLSAPPENLRWLEPFRNRLIVSLANNHTHDYGSDGFKDTERWLREYDIRFAPSDRLFNIEINGYNLRLHCIYEYTPDNYQQSFFKSSHDAANTFSCDAIDIIFVHWGEEHVLLPSPGQVRIARRWRNEGVDIIVGHHSHTAQGMQSGANGIIAYSLGNFNFRQPLKPPTNLNNIGFMLSIKLRNGAMICRRIPYYIDQEAHPRLNEISLSGYFAALDRALDGYASQSSFAMNIAYLNHSSYGYILDNLKHGFLPRIRSAGIGQFPALLKWLFHPRTLLRYPFMLSQQQDVVWQLYHKLCREQ